MCQRGCEERERSQWTRGNMQQKSGRRWPTVPSSLMHRRKGKHWRPALETEIASLGGSRNYRRPRSVQRAMANMHPAVHRAPTGAVTLNRLQAQLTTMQPCQWNWMSKRVSGEFKHQQMCPEMGQRIHW